MNKKQLTVIESFAADGEKEKSVIIRPQEIVIQDSEKTAELEKLEAVIQRGIGTFYEVGKALAEIRDNHLYRHVAGYQSFESYCKNRWEFASNYARRLIASSEAIDNIKSVPIGTLPVTESQARPLTKLEPDKQREAWQKAIDIAPAGKVTAAVVSKVVKEFCQEVGQVRERATLKKHSEDKMDAEFEEAWKQMFVSIKNLKGMKWSAMSKETVLKQIEILIDVVEV